MSRSIHRTRRDLEEARRSEYADAHDREAQLEQIAEQLEKKRRIKDEIEEERRRDDTPAPPTSLEAIPIHVLDEDEFVHYPATPHDIRAVMRRLPMGVLDGLQSIDLCLGMDLQEDDANPAEAEDERDPFIGRAGWELWPGVFSGRCLGAYRPGSVQIRLCAYVYESATPDREIKELYLRLRMLSALVHEVAHHFDMTARIARGRWRLEKGEKAEIYAERVQHDWVQRYVVPYLEEAYPEQLGVLNAWIEHHGGVFIPLSLLAGDPRTHEEGGGFRVFFSVPSAFEWLMKDVAAGEGLTETRIGFARELHYAENYTDVAGDHPARPVRVSGSSRGVDTAGGYLRTG